MANPTVVTDKSPASKARTIIGNGAGQLGLVTNVGTFETSTMDITFNDLSALNLKDQYTASDPGMLQLVSVGTEADEGKTANIEGISGDVVTIDVDLTSEIAENDVLAIIPPLSTRIGTQGGHTIGVQAQHDEEIPIGDHALASDTILAYNVGGDIPLFAGVDSPSVGRILMAHFGAHKVSTSAHTYRYIEDDDGTFDENRELFLYTQDGDGVSREVFLSLFVQQLQISVPQEGVSSLNASTVGTEAIREIGGTGKDFPTGAGNWDPDDFEADRGDRLAAKGARVQVGGTFGNDIEPANVDPYFQEVTINSTIQPTDVRPLGKLARAKQAMDTVTVQVQGTRLLEKNDVHADFYGGSPDPRNPTQERMLVEILNPEDTTKYLKVDFPQGTYRVRDVQRQQGHFAEQFTYQASMTLDGNREFDTDNPLLELEYENGDTTDYGTTI